MKTNLLTICICSVLMYQYPAIAANLSAIELSNLMISDTKSAVQAGKTIDDLLDRKQCIWLPTLRYSEKMFCSQTKVAAVIDNQPESDKVKYKFMPIYSIEEGCLYLTLKLNNSWEKCVALDTKSLLFLIEKISYIPVDAADKCIERAKDKSDGMSYKLRYNTISKCFENYLNKNKL